MITSGNATDAATKVDAGKRRRWVHISNRSDVTIYAKYDGGDTALTVANGIPIPAAGTLMLGNNGGDQDFWHDIWLIHGSAGQNKAFVIHQA